jgi:hypothetical protein
MEDHTLRTPPHPPYSPDLAPSDFFLFGYVKTAPKDRSFKVWKSFWNRQSGLWMRFQPTHWLAHFTSGSRVSRDVLIMMENMWNRDCFSLKNSVWNQYATKMRRGDL